MEEQLAELKQQTQQAAALAALWGWRCAQLRAATDLYLGAAFESPSPSASPTGGRGHPRPLPLRARAHH